MLIVQENAYVFNKDRLFNFGTGKDIEFVWVGRFDTGLNFIISSRSNHGSVIARKFW